MKHPCSYSVTWLVVACLASGILLFSGCGEQVQTPKDSQIIELQPVDPSVVGEFGGQIPPGAVPVSYYDTGHGSYRTVLFTGDISTFTRMVVSRIDFHFPDPQDYPHSIHFENQDVTTLWMCRVPEPAVPSGTIYLTYPIDGGGVGGGFSFPIGTGPNEVYSMNVTTGAGAGDYWAIVYGYVFNNP